MQKLHVAPCQHVDHSARMQSSVQSLTISIADPDRVEVEGVAVDDEGTIVREDAVWVDALPGGEGWQIRMSVPDVVHSTFKDGELELSTAIGGPRRRELGLAMDRVMPCVTIELTVSRQSHMQAVLVYRSLLTLSAATTFTKLAQTERNPIHGLELVGEAGLALRCWRLGIDSRTQQEMARLRPERAFPEITMAANLAATRFVHGQGRGLVFSCPGASLIHGGRKRWSAGPERMDKLQVREYATFTTPLNRHTDLVNLRCLVAAADGAPEPYTMAELEEASLRQTSLDADIGISRNSRQRGTMDLQAMTPSAFANHVVQACRREQPHDGLDAELAARLLKGGMFAKTLPLVLLHPHSPASSSTRFLAAEVLRGAANGAWLGGFWAQVCDLQVSRDVLLDVADGDEEHGYTVRARHNDLEETGWGASPEAARRDVLGRMIALTVGADRDAPLRTDVELMWPAHERLVHLLRAHGMVKSPARYERVDRTHYLAHVDVCSAVNGSRFTTFSATGPTKTRALEEVCEVGVGMLEGMPALSEPPPQALTAEMMERALTAYPDNPFRALAQTCSRCGLHTPLSDTLKGRSGERTRVRMEVDGVVAVAGGANLLEAKEHAVAQVLDVIAARPGMHQASRVPG
jgi:hypothetical protein